ncbi:MAG TPA: fibronectin type III domain-containing protein [Micromonosporaceae bacterium]|nr:fibronectin type III domain-containing protein [Micromonosporaceae bacterium]
MSGRTRARTIAAVLVATATAVAWAAPPASAADNLVTNPGFESGLTAWSCQNGSTVTSPVHSGTRALAGAADNVSNAKCTQTIAVQPSSAYTLSAWVRGSYVYLGATNYSSNWTPSATSWTQLSTSFTTGTGVTSVQIYLHGWYAQGTYYADDVVLTGPGGSVPIPPTPTGLAVTGTTASSVSLSWNASTGATSYTVRRNGANPVTVTGTSTTITGLASSTTYSFTVSASNSSGESAQSAPVSATTGSGQVPPAPTGLSVTGVTCSSVSLSWNASSGATSYRVYRGTTLATTVTTTSATVGGLNPSTSYSFQVSAVSSAGESAKSGAVSATTPSCPAGSWRSWPYIDVTMPSPSMASVANATGHRFFTTAFIIGSAAGCVPSWGGTIPLTEPRIVNDINAVKGMGGNVAVAFGGAVGPYLEHVCGSQAQLVAAYKQVIDTLGITRIDIDIEATVNIDMMNKALAQVQRDRPGTLVRFTLMVQGDDYGLNPALGVDVLTNAKANGVNVEIVNPMTMEFGSSRPDWGDAVIAAANSTLAQMAQIWPEKTDAQRRRMLGVTPMIGRNYNGRIFQLEDGNQLVAWANANDIGLLAFWSVGRDNGGCPGGPVSATCSSISQSTYQFTNIFKGFTG